MPAFYSIIIIINNETLREIKENTVLILYSFMDLRTVYSCEISHFMNLNPSTKTDSILFIVNEQMEGANCFLASLFFPA